MWRAARLYAAAPRTSSATANPNTSADPCLEWGFSPGSLLPSSPRSSTPGCRTIRRLRRCWPAPLRCPPSPRWSWTPLRPQPVRPATAVGWVRIPLNLWKWRRRERTKPLGWREHWSMRRRKAESPWGSWPALVRAACRRQKPLTCSCHCWRRGAAYDTIPACRFVRRASWSLRSDQFVGLLMTVCNLGGQRLQHYLSRHGQHYRRTRLRQGVLPFKPGGGGLSNHPIHQSQGSIFISVHDTRFCRIWISIYALQQQFSCRIHLMILLILFPRFFILITEHCVARPLKGPPPSVSSLQSNTTRFTLLMEHLHGFLFRVNQVWSWT